MASEYLDLASGEQISRCRFMAGFHVVSDDPAIFLLLYGKKLRENKVMHIF